jgi:hypothetical protein
MTNNMTTPFAGTEDTATVKARLTEVLERTQASGATSGYTDWGDARDDFNVMLAAGNKISGGEIASSFRPKLNGVIDLDSASWETAMDELRGSVPSLFVLADDTARLFTDAGVTAVSAPGNSIQEAWDDWLGDIAQIGAQSTAAARPTWGRAPKEVRNLLTNSDLAGAVAGTPGTAPTRWNDTLSTGTIAAVAADGLIGGNSIRIVGAVSGSLQRMLSQAVTLQADTIYRCSWLTEIYVGARIDRLIVATSLPAGASISYEIDGVPAASSDVPAIGLRTLSVVITVGATGGAVSIRFGVGHAGAVDADVRYWAPRLTLAADAGLPYQRRGATPTDITESGVTSFGLISMDGSDDALLHQLAAGGTVAVALFGRGGSYLIPSITLAAPSVLQLGPLSVLDDGVLVSGCPTGILRAVGTVPWSSRFELVGYAIMKANPTDEEKARAMRYFAAHGARGYFEAGADTAVNGGFGADTDWTKGTGWAIGSGVATKTAGSAGALEQAQTIAAAGVYLWTADITRSAGTLTPRFTGGTTFSGTAISAGGALSGILIGQSGNTTFGFNGDASFAGTVDNVTLQLLTPEF